MAWDVRDGRVGATAQEALAALQSEQNTSGLQGRLDAALADAKARMAELSTKDGDLRELQNRLAQAEFDAAALKEYNFKLSEDLEAKSSQQEATAAQLEASKVRKEERLNPTRFDRIPTLSEQRGLIWGRFGFRLKEPSVTVMV